MSDRFESLDSGEVVSVKDDQQVLSGHRTFRVGELSDAIKAQLASAISGWTEEKNGWFSERGIDGEALRFGSNGWQKGRIRLCLEFCPDEPTADRSASQSTSTAPNTHNVESIGQAIPTPATVPLPSSNSIGGNYAATPSPEVAIGSESVAVEPLTVPLPSTNLVASEESISSSIPEITQQPESASNIGIPIAAAAVGVVGTMAATAAVSAPEAPADLPLEAIQLESPPLVDTVLEEHHPEHPNTHHGVGLEEIAIDFTSDNRDLGIASPNGMMELDLNDLSMDFSEHDMLSFEANGLSDATDDFANFQDDKPENSGMLIDEVWNEINQGNWPSIN